MKIVRTRGGARVVQGDIILSEIPNRPRASGTLLDVLAACTVCLRPAGRMGLLGFAAGGVIAPLRALGHEGKVEAVDLSPDWEDLYHEMSEGWGGDVRIHRAEASAWLNRQRRPFDVLIDDLSEDSPDGIKKPWVSVAILPYLCLEKLHPEGLMVVNLLPWPDVSWKALIHEVREPFPQALLITFDDYENRILIAGRKLPPAREASRAIRQGLRAIGSVQAERVQFRALN